MANVQAVTGDTFDAEVLQSSTPVLVDFWAPWCGPCKQIGPVLDRISAARSDIKIVKVNIDDEADLAMKFRVMSIPFLAIFTDGKMQASRLGFAAEGDLSDWLSDELGK